MPNDNNRLVTVCDHCLRACCWQYEFCCSQYQTAGTKEMTVGELKKLNLEHPSYYSKKRIELIEGRWRP